MICCHNTLFTKSSSIRRTPSQLHSLQQIPTQPDMLPQQLVYKNEPNREHVITLARNDETPWWWSEKRSKHVGVVLSVLKCFKWKLCRCICWLIVEGFLRNGRCNGEIHVELICIIVNRLLCDSSTRLYYVTSRCTIINRLAPELLFFF